MSQHDKNRSDIAAHSEAHLSNTDLGDLDCLPSTKHEHHEGQGRQPDQGQRQGTLARARALHPGEKENQYA